jgi:hypothetical protein
MIRLESHQAKEILILDYQDEDEKGMLQTLEAARQKVLHDRKPVWVLTVFGEKNYVNSAFIELAQSAARK